MEQTEIRKNVIAGFENYFIYEDGRVWNREKHFFVKPKKSPQGYIMLQLKKEGKFKTCMVHRLILNGFVYNQNNKPFVNHINGVKDDNSLNNLEWCTHQENMTHGAKLGLFQKGRKKPQEEIDICKKNLLLSYEKIKKPVIDTNTGIIYSSIKNAADAFGYKDVTLSGWLTGRYKNKSSLKLLTSNT